MYWILLAKHLVPMAVSCEKSKNISILLKIKTFSWPAELLISSKYGRLLELFDQWLAQSYVNEFYSLLLNSEIC